MILDKFPVRVGIPHQKKCNTKKEALERINKNNGVNDIYATLHNGTINKVTWDFDIEPDDDFRYSTFEQALTDLRNLKEYVEDEGYSYMCVFSGNGFHFYLKCVDSKLDNARAALRAVQERYQKDIGIGEFHDEGYLRTDPQIFGDVERIFRVPNTYHPGAGRYCVPLEPEEIYLSKEEIFELAQKQRFDVDAIVDGGEYPIYQHDQSGNSPYVSGPRIEGDFNPAEIEPEGTVMPIYPCISNLLLNHNELEQVGHGLGFRRRFLIILHLKETGHTYEETISVLKKYLSDDEFYHCVIDEEQPRHIYNRPDLLFPDCRQLESEIACIHKPEKDDPCESRNDLYI